MTSRTADLLRAAIRGAPDDMSRASMLAAVHNDPELLQVFREELDWLCGTCGMPWTRCDTLKVRSGGLVAECCSDCDHNDWAVKMDNCPCAELSGDHPVSLHALPTADANLLTCHCGDPLYYGFDDDPTRHRGMCQRCDAVRCDVDPASCRLPDDAHEIGSDPLYDALVAVYVDHGVAEWYAHVLAEHGDNMAAALDRYSHRPERAP